MSGQALFRFKTASGCIFCSTSLVPEAPRIITRLVGKIEKETSFVSFARSQKADVDLSVERNKKERAEGKLDQTT